MAHSFRNAVLTLSLLPLLSAFPDSAHCSIPPVVSPLASITEGTSTPVRLAADSLGNIYVADPRGGGILKYNNSGKLQKTIATTKDVLGIAIAQNGDLLASQGSYVAVLDSSSGAPLSRFGAFGKANGIAVDASGYVYVTDSANNCVQVFNAAYAPISTGVAASGQPANSFGSKGLSLGQFSQPTGISYEKISKQLAIADTLNGRIQFFSTSGIYQKSLGSFGSGPLRFTSPQGIAFEYSKDGKTVNRIYIVDSYQSNVQVIDAASGTFLRNIGSYGMASGKLVVPADVLYDQFDSLNNRLIVANGTGAVAMFGIDKSGITLPSTGPALTINSVPLATNLTTLTITGTTAGGATVTVNGTVATLTGTTWTSTINLTTGANVITVAAANVGGTTVETVNVNVLASTSGLTPVALTVTPLSTLTGTSLITISGTVTSGAGVSINGTSATVSGTSWSFPATLGQGVNNFQVIASKTGLGDSTESFNITLDNTPPVLTAYLLPSGATTSTPVQTISGTVSDSSASSVTVTVNGASQTAPTLNGQFSLAIPLGYGANNLTIAAMDAAGNSSTSLARTINYDPQAPLATVTTPNGTVCGSTGFTLSGTAPAGSTVTVNSIPATVSNPAVVKAAGAQAMMSGATWTATVTLLPGVNYFEVKVTDPLSGKSSSTAETVTYNQGIPAIAVTKPLQDIATAKPTLAIAGTAAMGSAVSATVNGASVPVTIDNSGAFILTPLNLSVPGSYAIAISATDNLGNTSVTTRTVVFDPSVPVITVASAEPPKVTATGGVLVCKDKNGPVGSVTVSGDISSLDLSGVIYDPSSLNIYAITAAGTSSRDGDVNGDGQVDVADALVALQMSLGIVQPSFQQMLHSDVGPLANHAPVPDGKVRLDDAIVILRKAVGIDW